MKKKVLSKINYKSLKRLIALFIGFYCCFLITNLNAQSLHHPVIFVTNEERTEILEKFDWAKSIIEQLHERVDDKLNAHQLDPFNYPMHSRFAAYFFESLGGIKSTSEKAGYKVFKVNPMLPTSINSTSVSIPTPYGNINHSWHKTNTNFKSQLKVPFNTKAQLVLTKKEFDTLKVNGESFSKSELVQVDKISDQYTIELGSGRYVIEYN